MKTGRFIPLSEVPGPGDFDPATDALSWSFSLPPALDQERIVVDSRALGRVHAVGSIRASHVTEYRGGGHSVRC